MTHPCPASFDADDRAVVTGPGGQRVHREQLAQHDRLAPRMWDVAPGVWCLVGNGLSNQTFVEGPEGIIAVDTGESVQEMRAALAELRTRTQRPIAAVIYTHFHYVAGTRAIEGDEHVAGYPVWGHERITTNRTRMAAETGMTLRRGVVGQFGLPLPQDGPDGLLHVGLGRFFRNPDHAPFTDGFVAPTHTFAEPVTTTIAGLQVELTPAPSDSDDSITIWFPELLVAVQNNVWPALFNVYAVRGEEYRDPRVVVRGIDHLRGYPAEHLVATHGPPVSGRAAVAEETERARDAVQFIWDQTVRSMNRGLVAGEIIDAVQLPACFGESFRTQQLYGLVEHHTRQVQSGIRGWFDGYEAELFPLPTQERCRRLIDGFGGRDVVRDEARAALAGDDVRWALELATWLVRSETAEDGRADGGSAEERALLASVLRTIARRTTSANMRNWCLVRALELEGRTDLTRFRRPRFSVEEVLAAPPATFVHVLRVLLDPLRAEGVDVHVAWAFEGGERTGLHVRRCVAVPTDGEGASATVHLAHRTWAELLAGRSSLGDAVRAGRVRIEGDAEAVGRMLAVFDLGAPGADPVRSAR